MLDGSTDPFVPSDARPWQVRPLVLPEPHAWRQNHRSCQIHFLGGFTNFRSAESTNALSATLGAVVVWPLALPDLQKYRDQQSNTQIQVDGSDHLAADQQ